MIKVLYIVSTLKSSGPTNQLYNLIKHLDCNKFEPHLITLSPEPSDSRWNDYEALGVQLHTLGISRLKGIFISSRKLRSLALHIAPDIIHTQGIRADILNAKSLKGYPSLCTSRNYPFSDYPAKFGKFKGGMMARQHIAAFRKSHVIACSVAIQSQLATQGVKADVVQNGVDTYNFFSVHGFRKNELRRKLGLSEDARVILSVGSLIPRKNVHTLLLAYQKAALGNKAQLIVLGEGSLMPSLRQHADDTVWFPGNVNNVVEYLQSADLFVSSSLAEGLPNTVLEAMACGLPCYLSDIPSHRELFGKDGVYFDSGDTVTLSSLISTVDYNQLSEMSRFSRMKIEDYFSAEKMSKNYQAKYKELIGTINQ